MTTAPLYMDATITGNRSLSSRGFALLLAAVAGINLVVGFSFWRMGAPIIPAFLGLDVLAVWLAFRASYRAGGQQERVQVSAEQVRVLRGRPDALTDVWSSPTAFTRVDLEEGEDLPVRRLRLHLSGRRLTIAGALSPKERDAFADALREAIRKARLERG